MIAIVAARHHRARDRSRLLHRRVGAKDFRRGLAAMTDLVVAFGRNLSSAEKRGDA
jgi:hypothetical protein